MRRSVSLIRGIFIRYLLGIVCSVLAIGLIWLFSSHRELASETEILKQQAVQLQRTQLRERVEHVRDMIIHEQQQLDSRMRKQIRQRTLEAHAVMAELYQLTKDSYSQAEIADLIRTSLRAIKYNDNRGYYFATRLDGVEQLFPPNPSLEGTSFLNVRDMNGKPVVQDMIKLIKAQGEGFYEYSWPKPDSSEEYRKVAYIKHFAPLNWLVGTGEYIDDLTADLQQEMIGRIEDIRFDDGGYIFVATYNGVSLAYPAKGSNMYQVEDNNGVKIVQELIRLAQTGGGYLRYVMPPKLGERPEAKISYVTGIPAWRWYLGSGDFIADLDQELAGMLAKRERAIFLKMVTICATLVIFTLLGIIFSRQLVRQINTSLEKFQVFFSRAAVNAEPIDADRQAFREFESLANSANRMLEERTHFESEAREYRDQLQNVIDSMPSILTTINLAGQVSQWNKFAVEQTGIPHSEAHGKALIDLLPYLEPHLEMILATASNHEQFFQANLELDNDGKHSFLSVSAYPLGTPTVHSVVVRIDDMTDRRLLEKTLVQSEKMLSVGGLAAGMAHEVNNPLSAIMQNLHLIERRLLFDSPKTRQLSETHAIDFAAMQKLLTDSGIPEKLENAKTSCQRAATIVKNMLNFSRDGQSDFKATDLIELLDSTLDLLKNDFDFQRKYDFQAISIDRKYPAQMPEVVCEGSKIQQVIFNLLKNGAQSMALANIPLQQRRFEIELFTVSKMAVIRISDSGPGMSTQVQKRIFEPFFTTKTVGSGTGLGLFIAYFIIHENHNGEISVDSTPGQGSRFTIKLPLQQPRR